MIKYQPQTKTMKRRGKTYINNFKCIEDKLKPVNILLTKPTAFGCFFDI